MAKVVVDGSNVAYEELSSGGTPKVSNLVGISKYLKGRGFEPIILVDASLFHNVDDPDQLDALINKEEIHQVPAGTDADYWVLEVAEKEQALVISNDRFDPYQEKHPWIEERRVPFMIIDGGIQLYEPKIDELQEGSEGEPDG